MENKLTAQVGEGGLARRWYEPAVFGAVMGVLFCALVGLQFAILGREATAKQMTERGLSVIGLLLSYLIAGPSAGAVLGLLLPRKPTRTSCYLVTSLALSIGLLAPATQVFGSIWKWSTFEFVSVVILALIFAIVVTENAVLPWVRHGGVLGVDGRDDSNISP